MKKEKAPFDDSLERFQTKLQQLKETFENYQIKIETTSSHLKQAEVSLESSHEKEKIIKDNLQKLETERNALLEKESILTQQLRNTLQNLLQYNVYKQSSERQMKHRQLLNEMVKLFPGVRGKLIDLCSPIHKKFEDALGIILGKNTNSIVVERESVARDCIKFLKDKRATPMTFIPLDSIVTKSIPDVVKNLTAHSNSSIRNGIKLSIDVIHMETKDLYPAFLYAMGNSIICDNISLAKLICYEMNIKTKGSFFTLTCSCHY